MAIPSSGALALSAIQTEFGGANPISLSEYYAGGARVPAGTTGTNGAVPSSGTISVSKFYGTTAETVTISDQFVTATRVASGTAVTVYQLASTGDINRTVNTNTTDIGDWITPKSAASGYEVFATLVSGTLTSGTTGSWLALSSSRSWNVNRSTFGTSTAVVGLQIRKVGTTTVLDSATITLEANWEP
jgi:hypothetical protein